MRSAVAVRRSHGGRKTLDKVYAQTAGQNIGRPPMGNWANVRMQRAACATLRLCVQGILVNDFRDGYHGIRPRLG